MRGEGAPVQPAGFSFIPLQLTAAPMRVFTISGLSTRSACRLRARTVAMRANSIGPPRSAALVISSAAVRMTGVPRSDDGTVLTRYPARHQPIASVNIEVKAGYVIDLSDDPPMRTIPPVG
jgi:hypothetical protein